MDPINAWVKNVSDLRAAKEEFVRSVKRAQERKQGVTNRKKEISRQQRLLKEDERAVRESHAELASVSEKRFALRRRIESEGGSVFARTVADVNLIADEVERYGFDCFVLTTDQAILRRAEAAGLKCKILGDM